jgi:hypothetical protein
MFSKEIRVELAEELYFYFKDNDVTDTYLFDLVYDFDSNYYIIGTYKAKQWLQKYFFDIEEALEYNEQHYDKDYSYLIREPELMVNVVAIAVIEEIFIDMANDLEELELFDNLIQEEDIEQILNYLKEIFKVK